MTEEWVFGNYVQLRDERGGLELNVVSREAESDGRGGFTNIWSEVMPETVGQFTGLHDINGKEVYEGDIVRYRLTDERYKKNPRFANLPIHYDEGHARFEAGNIYWDALRPGKIEVVGNIYDNPELLDKEG